MTICEGSAPHGASWGDDDSIVFAVSSGCGGAAAGGGEPEQLTTPEPG